MATHQIPSTPEEQQAVIEGLLRQAYQKGVADARAAAQPAPAAAPAAPAQPTSRPTATSSGPGILQLTCAAALALIAASYGFSRVKEQFGAQQFGTSSQTIQGENHTYTMQGKKPAITLPNGNVYTFENKHTRDHAFNAAGSYGASASDLEKALDDMAGKDKHITSHEAGVQGSYVKK